MQNLQKNAENCLDLVSSFRKQNINLQPKMTQQVQTFYRVAESSRRWSNRSFFTNWSLVARTINVRSFGTIGFAEAPYWTNPSNFRMQWYWKTIGNCAEVPGGSPFRGLNCVKAWARPPVPYGQRSAQRERREISKLFQKCETALLPNFPFAIGRELLESHRPRSGWIQDFRLQ